MRINEFEGMGSDNEQGKHRDSIPIDPDEMLADLKEQCKKSALNQQPQGAGSSKETSSEEKVSETDLDNTESQRSMDKPPDPDSIDPDEVLEHIRELSRKREQQRRSEKVVADSNTKSAQIKAGHRRKAERGEYPYPAPFGYRNNTDLKLIGIHSVQGPVVIMLFELVVRYGLSISELQLLLGVDGNGRKIAASRFGRREIVQILTNPIYGGKFLFKGRLIDGVHDPIVSWAMFERVQRLPGLAKKNR